MKAQLALALPCALLVAIPARARAEAPPVEIQVVDEDEDGDFFDGDDQSDAKPEEKKADEKSDEDEDTSKSSVEKRAKAAFEELDAQQGAKIKKRKKGRQAGNDNINQNVVNVVVVGDKNTKAEAKNDNKVQAKTDSKAEASQPAKPAEPPPVQKPVVQAQDSGCPYAKAGWKGWWDRPNAIASGDVLLSYSVGGYGGGAYHGLGVEGMVNNWAGLKLAVHGAFFDRHERFHEVGEGRRFDSGELDFFTGGRSPTPDVNGVAVGSALLHMEDLSLTIHLGHRHGLDITPSLGVSHFGYVVDTDAVALEGGSIGGSKLRGGSVYARLGLSATWMYKRFFIGVDAGWYPLEMYRYTIADRGRGGSDVHEEAIDQPYDSKRATVAFTVGLSL